MTTQADYDFLKAVENELINSRPFSPHRTKALSQVGTRLFTINLALRPELPLPQELTDKIYHEALMSELKERPRSSYSEPLVENFWLGLCDVLRLEPNCRTIMLRRRDKSSKKVNKKEFLIKVLNKNGVKCNKNWSVKRLIKLLFT